MRIDVDEYVLYLNENELYTIACALRDKLLESAGHCAMHTGMDTFWSNYAAEAKMLKDIAGRLGRDFIYNDCIDQLEKKISELQAD